MQEPYASRIGADQMSASTSPVLHERDIDLELELVPVELALIKHTDRSASANSVASHSNLMDYRHDGHGL